MHNNDVFINDDGIVEIIVRGDQTKQSVEAMATQAFILSKEIREKGNPAYILDNLLEIGYVPAEARRTVVDLIKSDAYDRLAMLGNGPLLRLGSNLMLQATGKGARVKYFEDRKKSMSWLTRP